MNAAFLDNDMRNNAQDPQDLAGDETLVFPNNLPQIFYETAVRMPEIGRSVIHTEGVQLIAD